MDRLLRIIVLCVVLNTVLATDHFCDFENEKSLCGYVQDTEDNFNWNIRQGGTPTPETGPSFDHTLGVNSTGHYMYIEASGQGTWDLARFISPTFDPTPAFCLRFFYHMYGRDMGRLSVRSWVGAGQQVDTTAEELWTLKGDQGDQWVEAVIDGSSSSEFQVVFEAKRGEGFKSDIAIDDITLKSETTCGGTVVTLSPTSKPVTSRQDPSPTSPEPTTDRSSVVTKPPAISVSQQPQSEVTSTFLLEPIDNKLVMVVLTVGLSFWGVVCTALAIVIYKSSRSALHRKDNLTYDAIDAPIGHDGTATTSEEKQCRDEQYV